MKRQIVITLYDDEYNSIMDYGLILEADREIFAQAIKNGVPLPKGHGRLKDVDAIMRELSVVSSRPVKSQMYMIEQAPTVVEADKEK